MSKLVNLVAVLFLGGIAVMLWALLLPAPVREGITRFIPGTSSEDPGAESSGVPAADQLLSASDLDELRGFALELINRDRSDHGLLPVAMGSNPAAQLHAEDMLAHEYLGHWWVDGRKPYMVYTQTGGTSYVAENVALDGWTSEHWRESGCGALRVVCELPVPDEAVRAAEWGMVYDDAHADWGHRDNILGPAHRAVNLGIAWNGRLLTFAQHFEGGDVEGRSLELTSDGVLSFSLRKRAAGVDLANVVSVYYDPPPEARSPAEIRALDRYCVGGGFTTECARPTARLLAPPGAGRFYADLGADAIVASEWRETPLNFELRAELGALAEFLR